MKNACKLFVEKYKDNRPTRRKGVGGRMIYDVGRIKLAQDRTQSRTLLKTLMNPPTNRDHWC